MNAAKSVFDEHENRVAIITAIAIDAHVITSDDGEDKIRVAGDSNAEKIVYARAFQAWADDKMEGTAEDIFETVQEVLES